MWWRCKIKTLFKCTNTKNDVLKWWKCIIWIHFVNSLRGMRGTFWKLERNYYYIHRLNYDFSYKSLSSWYLFNAFLIPIQAHLKVIKERGEKDITTKSYWADIFLDNQQMPNERLKGSNTIQIPKFFTRAVKSCSAIVMFACFIDGAYSQQHKRNKQFAKRICILYINIMDLFSYQNTIVK